MGNEAPLERLRESLYDSDWCLRDAAVRALGMLEESLSPGEPVVSALIDRLVSDANETVRLTALRALRKRAPLEVFVSALRDRDGEVRAAAAKILGELGEQAPVESLIEALHDSNWQVRDAAAKALGSLGKRIAVGPLQEALRDSHWAVRAAAAHSLGGQGILEPLLPVLGDSEKTVREMTLNRLRSHPEILSLVAPEAQVILLGQGMGTVLGSLTQSFIAEALGNMTHPSPVLLEKLTQLLDWPYWEVRMKAIQALKKMPRNIPDAAIRRLLELRHDPESQAVRNAADDALAEILSLETGIEDD